jgi:hypothetical protein
VRARFGASSKWAVQQNKKRPRFLGGVMHSLKSPQTRKGYFFFLAGAFFAAFFAAFLVAFFIGSILPKRKICNLYRSQCDSYIR